MAHAGEIIVLDDDDDEEPLQSSEVKKSPCKTPPRQSNGKKEGANNMSAENKRLFEEFVDYCSKLTTEHPEVIAFLQGRHAKANPVYLSSVAFRNTLGSCLTRVQNKRSKVFVYINELCTVLKANSQKRKVSLHSPAQQTPAAEVAESANDKEGETEEAPEIKKGSKRQIRYLENLLRIYSQEIHKLQEKELSLEDLEDEDSSYIQESRLKRKLLRIFEKLCELKDCPSLTGRVIEQRIQYRGTRYPEVNRRLEKFINSSRDIFPDYGDVLRVIQKANEKHNLTLSRKQMQSMAQDAFRELGNKLQDRRHLDMVYNFGSHLTDSFRNVNDPALQDHALSRHLRDNRNTALSHLDAIIKKYAEMQDDGEEEERKKWKRESEMPSTSKDEKGAQSSRRSSSPASDEEEEESEDSDTDIEEELKQCEQIEDGEDGEEEEEESPGDQENDADPNMDTASDPQVISGGEEDGEKAEEDGDEDLIEETEEATGQESSPASTSLSNDKESLNTSLESEEDVRPSATFGLQCNDTTTSARIEDENSREEEDCANQNNTSGETSLEDHTEVQDESSGVKGEGEKEDANVPLECEPPIRQIEDSGKSTDGKNNLLLGITGSLAEQAEDNESGEEDIAEVADDISQGESGDERTVPETEQLSPSENVSKDCSIGDYSDEPCEQSRTSMDTEVQSSEACTAPGTEQDCVDTLVKSPSGNDVEPCAVDEDGGEMNTDCDRSPLGNSNGVDAATEMENTSVHRLKRDKRSKLSLIDSIKHKKVKEEKTPSRKRKKSQSPTWTENGITKYNGSDQGDARLKRKCKKAKTDCSSNTSLSSSMDADSDNDITLDLVVTCSPSNTPPRSSEQCTKSHASTQCDPDEVIVLSD